MDARLKSIARRQHGILTKSQALEVVSLATLRTALARGELDLVSPGIYRVGGMPKSWRSDVMAAVLASGDGAVASHTTAAALWGLAGFPPKTVDITVPHGSHHRPGVHQTRSMEPIDATTIDRIPVTRVARTLFDLAGLVSASRVGGRPR